MFCPASAVSYAKLHGAHCYHLYAVIPKKSRVQNTESKVSNPEYRVQSILKEHEREEVKILDLEIINYRLYNCLPILWSLQCLSIKTGLFNHNPVLSTSGGS